MRSGPNQGCELASHDHIASYTNPIVPTLFSPPAPSNFFPPFLFCSFQRGREVPSLCVKLFELHPGALNKHARAPTFDHLIPLLLSIASKSCRRWVTNIICRKVPSEKVLVSSSRQSLSALKHHHYMSFSAQLPLNTKRGIVQSNPVVNTKWSHFIATALLLFSPLRFWKSFK